MGPDVNLAFPADEDFDAEEEGEEEDDDVIDDDDDEDAEAPQALMLAEAEKLRQALKKVSSRPWLLI